MPELMVTGKRKLQGNIKISGAKNAVLPQMAASLLTREKVTLTNVPNITDVEDMKLTLEAYGVTVDWDKRNSTLVLQAENPTSSLPSTTVGKKIRGSFDIFGPLLARTGKAEVYKPGGCRIEKEPRKVNYHIQAMEGMKAELTSTKTDDFVSMKVENGLKAATITFKESSVGATKTAMMAASLVEDETVIRRAAIEPEIYDLHKMLVAMGADISIKEDVKITDKDIKKFHIKDIVVWNVIRVTGRKSLRGVNHRVMLDRIEFGTYAIAAAMNNGEIILEVEEDMKEDMLKAIRKPLDDAGVKIEDMRNSRGQLYGIKISLKNGIISPVHIKTGPYPGFPTDLAPLWVVFMTQAQASGNQASAELNHAIIHDTIHDDRFKCVDDLKTMGAKIDKVSQPTFKKGPGNEVELTCHVHAGSNLNGTPVKATDLRGGAALVLAGLVAKGTTVVKVFQHIQRGYEDMVGKLNKCGAKLEILKPETRPGHRGGPSAF